MRKLKIRNKKNFADLSAEEFMVKKGDVKSDAFLICFNGRYFAYENSCPHTGGNLNWQEGQFFSFDGRYLQCTLHGALFEPKSGKCIQGPCFGAYLKSIEIVVEDECVFLLDESS